MHQPYLTKNNNLKTEIVKRSSWKHPDASNAIHNDSVAYVLLVLKR